ncbi:MAG: undecaprenyl-diphosphate phosphatase [Clostridia bacterium]|nr:undecaprenyl-diphosphate phosphatase [Clostridia bacterium]
MEFWELLKSALMGVVQGITEWLPISSTAHLKLAQQLLPLFPHDAIGPAFSSMYDVVIQLGSILAVVVLYFHKLNPLSPKKTSEQKKETFWLWGKVLIASIPAAIAGLLIDDWLDSMETEHTAVFLYIIAAALIVYGILFIVMESVVRKPKVNDLTELSPKRALGIGAFQMLALIPGTSRSGSTILGATALGAARSVAAEFSFFMAIPVMFGASGIKLLKAALEGTLAQFEWLHWASLIVGFVVSFIVSVVVIRVFMNYIKKHDFKGFGVYRILIGIVVLIAVPVLL